MSVTCGKAVPEFAVRSKHELIGLRLIVKKLIGTEASVLL